MSSASSTLARLLLGGLILRPALLEGSDVASGDFPAGRLRETFAAIAAFWEDGRPTEIDPGLLALKIGGDGSASFIGSLLDGLARIEPAAFRDRLRELRRQTLRRRAIAETEAALRGEERTGEVDPAEVEKVRATWTELDRIDAGGRGAFDPAAVLKNGAEIQALDLRVEWTVERLLPAGAVTVIYGRSGIGKTWISLMIAKAVSTGTPIFGLATKGRTVCYVDMENPLSVMKERVCRLDIRAVQFWHGSFDPRPPKLDSPEWTRYKDLPPGSLLIFDTARSLHDMKENDSEAPAVVLGRLKTLRDLGFEILLHHHTAKADDQNAKGSSGWIDLADHTLSFCRVRQGSLEEVDDGGAFDPRALLSLGCGKKTRFEPQPRIYLTLDPSAGGLVLAESPEAEGINALAEYLAGTGAGKDQSEIIAWAKENEVGPKRRAAFISLLNRGEGVHWRSHTGFRGKRIYEPLD